MLLKACIIAFSMYSIIPMPRAEWKEKDMRYMLCFYPLIGVFAGALCWLWLSFCSAHGVGSVLTAAVAAVLSPLISGSIHLDGFCDTCDALASHAPRERKLEILKDSNVGAFAVIGCCIYFLLSFGVWSEYRFTPRTAVAVAGSFVLSRAFGGFSVSALRRARRDGLAATFGDAATRRTSVVLMLYVAVCGAVMIAADPLAGTFALIAAFLVFAYHCAMAFKIFGGTTGDLAGHCTMLCELFCPAAVVLASFLR